MQENIQASEVLRVQDLGMGRDTATDRIILGFANYAEARIAKWVQFPRGVLLFLMVPGDPGIGLLLRARPGARHLLHAGHPGRRPLGRLPFRRMRRADSGVRAETDGGKAAPAACRGVTGF